jgi:hypothetical protein
VSADVAAMSHMLHTLTTSGAAFPPHDSAAGRIDDHHATIKVVRMTPDGDGAMAASTGEASMGDGMHIEILADPASTTRTRSGTAIVAVSMNASAGGDGAAALNADGGAALASPLVGVGAIDSAEVPESTRLAM